jgi:hypothetical protein
MAKAYVAAWRCVSQLGVMCVGLAGAVSWDHPLEIRQSTTTHVPNIKRLLMRRLNSTPEPKTRKEILCGRIQEFRGCRRKILADTDE